ncbi:matrixin family metalloprotease [Paeniglutamicibacter sp. NPDC091659]|uniref:matrixin family metalloprotease n=1 Tax=Paeniglutamicibacter sp. NPDC091659 TaxID=3364389 RepID=UPI003819D4BA
MPDQTNDQSNHGSAHGPGSERAYGQFPVPRSASGRVPQWAVEEARRRQDPDFTVPAAPGKKPRRRRNAGAWLRPGARRNFMVGAGIVVALYSSTVVLEDHVIPVLQSNLPWSDVPPRGVEAAAKPLGTPPAAQDSTGYQLHPSPDKKQKFVAYDPCRPIHYVIRPDGAPANAERLVHEAAEAVSAASGLRFVYDGTTTEAPSAQRPQYQPERYGKRWVPVLVTWSSPAEIPALAGDVAGLGGSSYISAKGTPLVFAAGQVNLDGPDVAAMMGHPQGTEHVRAVIMHEFGHVLGLDHVKDPNQLMFEGPSYRTSFAPGDLAGLAKLGTGACVPQL